MSKVKSPIEKRRLAYERDHYNRNGESNKSWRRAKPLKKKKARRAFRKASKDMLRVSANVPENTSASVLRKRESIRQRRVNDWGAVRFKEFVDTRRIRNLQNVGAKKARRAARLGKTV